jgi:hypothetical protein
VSQGLLRVTAPVFKLLSALPVVGRLSVMRTTA